MKKTALGIFAIVSMACASPISTQTATLTGVNGASVDGSYTSPYYLTLGSTPLQVFCDDFLDSAAIGGSWEANVYSGTNLSGTYFALTDPNYIADYARIFWLTDQSTSGAVDPVTAQQAIWSIFDPAYLGTAASAALALQSIGTTVDPSRFIVIDGVNAGTGRVQEFVADPPADAPEPGTAWLMLGFGSVVLVARRGIWASA